MSSGATLWALHRPVLQTLARFDAEENDARGYLTPTLLDIGMASYIDGALLARCFQPKVATLAWADT